MKIPERIALLLALHYEESVSDKLLEFMAGATPSVWLALEYTLPNSPTLSFAVARAKYLSDKVQRDSNVET